jgi:hypothetical protein
VLAMSAVKSKQRLSSDADLSALERDLDLSLASAAVADDARRTVSTPPSSTAASSSKRADIDLAALEADIEGLASKAQTTPRSEGSRVAKAAAAARATPQSADLLGDLESLVAEADSTVRTSSRGQPSVVAKARPTRAAVAAANDNETMDDILAQVRFAFRKCVCFVHRWVLLLLHRPNVSRNVVRTDKAATLQNR